MAVKAGIKIAAEIAAAATHLVKIFIFVSLFLC
jgi:hypothetical protein